MIGNLLPVCVLSNKAKGIDSITQPFFEKVGYETFAKLASSSSLHFIPTLQVLS